jgi:hypothetical protein
MDALGCAVDHHEASNKVRFTRQCTSIEATTGQVPRLGFAPPPLGIWGNGRGGYCMSS